MRVTHLNGYTLLCMPYYVVDDFGNQVQAIDYSAHFFRT